MTGLVPEPPELLLVWSQGAVIPGPGVSSAVPDPHVVAGVGEHEAQTGVWQVGDPVAACGQESMLQEDGRPLTWWTCQTFRTSRTSRSRHSRGSDWISESLTCGVLASAWDPVDGQNIAVLRWNLVFLCRVTPPTHNL